MDAIGGLLEGLASAADIACSGLGLNDFDQAMSYQASLIESESISTQATINAQTEIMQSEAANNRLNQELSQSYTHVYEGGRGGKGITIAGVFFVVAYLICMLVLTVALI